MPRTFAYVRVSTTSQTTDNQIQEIQAAGFKVEPRRVVTETISGSVATAQRWGFTACSTGSNPATSSSSQNLVASAAMRWM